MIVRLVNLFKGEGHHGDVLQPDARKRDRRREYLVPDDIGLAGIRIDFSTRLPGRPASRRWPARAQAGVEAIPSTGSVQWKASSMSRKAEDSLGYNLRLYVAGQTPKSIAAICNLRRLCEKYLSGRYRLDVIDLMAEPNLAQRDQIVAIPTLVRSMPEPIKRIIGDLSNSRRVLTWLGIDASVKA